MAMVPQLCGLWVHGTGCMKMAGSLVGRIDGQKLHWAARYGGGEVELHEGNGRIMMDLAGVQYTATWDGEQLAWNNGDAWHHDRP